jgi:hypothetical protein
MRRIGDDHSPEFQWIRKFMDSAAYGKRPAGHQPGASCQVAAFMASTSWS